MPDAANPIKSLAALLQSSEAKPRVVPSRLAPSALYDIDYRIAIVALVFESFAKPTGAGSARRIQAARLKLLQFVVARPWLIPAVREWSEGTGQAAFAFAHSMRIRRGFLSDTAHDDVMQFLSASGVLERADSHVVTGPNSTNLEKVTGLIREMDLFERERSAIDTLRAIKLTANMLEGW